MNLITPDKLPRIDLIETGRNIEYLRRLHGLSVKDLQEYFGFASPQTIYKWQWGESIPSIDNLVILSDLFKTPMERILRIEKPKPLNGKSKVKSERRAIPLMVLRRKPRITKKREFAITQNPA